MKRRTVLIFGESGLVGSELVRVFQKDFEVIAPTHKELDLSKFRQIRNSIETIAPDQIIYAAGITKLDVAEKRPKMAFLLNSEVPEIICELAATQKIPFHYLSTNAVFDGTQSSRPYQETDNPSPISIYGKSKLRGEQAALKSSATNTVLRTIMPYTVLFEKKKDFARIVLESLQKGEKIKGIVDQIINPIYVKTLAQAIKKIIETKSTGIYHLAAIDWSSNEAFAKKIAKAFGFSESLIIPTTIQKFYGKKTGKRSPYYWLGTNKFRKKFGKGILHTLNEDLKLFQRDFSKSHTYTNNNISEATSTA